jgi:hypothetical protein
MNRLGLELPRWAVFVAALTGSAAALCQAPEGDREPLALCADDAETAFAALAEEIRSASRFVELTPGSRCAETEPPSGSEGAAPRYRGRFAIDGDGLVTLVLSSAAAPGEARSCRVPWLGSLDRPLAATIDAGKTYALTLLVDGLVLDFRNLSLLGLPVPRPAEVAPEPGVEPALEASREPPQPARAEIAWGLEVGAGAAYISPDAVAPRVEIGGSLGAGRWRAVVDVHAELDSTYAIGARSFDTFSSGARLGARYRFFRGARSLVGVELAAAWIQNRFRRDDIPGTRVRTWADFGVFAGAFGRVRLAGPLGLFLRAGVGIFPTARVTEIADGPQKQVNLVTVPGVAGIDFDF